MNKSTAVSDESSFENIIDIENPKNFSNPLVNMPRGHEKFSSEDAEKCPVMSGKIKAPTNHPTAQAQQDDDSDTSSDSDDDEEESQLKMPSGHEGYSEADKEKCPVMSGKVKAPGASEIEMGKQGEQPKKKKQKKPKGGCPFMPSENKKAPSLEIYETAYEIPYVSTLRHLFSFRGLLAKDKAESSNREKFEQYPIFLKHTLFHNEEKFEKIRKLEVAHRFFVYDKFREQGNKKFNRGKLNESISLYEHAMSCFKWLNMKEAEKKEEESKEEEKYDPLASLKPINKALVSILSDDNVELHDGEELTDSNEKEMRNSMLLNIYLALACCYLKLNHYTTALEVIEEGFKISSANSQLLFRRSQARAYNKCASLEDLYKAKDDITKAIEIKNYEKIFQSEPGILKILNIHNAGEIYVEHARIVEDRIKERLEEEKIAINGLFHRVKEIEYIEETMLKEGRIPHDEDDDHAVEIIDEENMEYDVVREMNGKYVKVIEFYLETDKKDQVALARKEIQGTLEIHHKMKVYLDLDFKNPENNSLMKECLKEFTMIDLAKPKTVRRLERLKVSKAKEIFESAHFNLEMFQYAVKDYFKKKEEREKKKKEEEEPEADGKASKFSWLSSIFGVEFGLQILVLVLLFGLFWYFNKNSLFGNSDH